MAIFAKQMIYRKTECCGNIFFTAFLSGINTVITQKSSAIA
ncbi:MAG: hypothetical protein PUP90_08320 [Nostoc sp. S4]|nr:hypothetical protein [Nostoc sp. S4]